MENILAVAAAIVQYAADNNQPVNCFRLQKLLVRLQQRAVEETGHKCFTDEPEQWLSGPVFRAVWNEYRKWGRDPILRASDVYELRLENMKCVRISCMVSAECRKRVEQAVHSYERKDIMYILWYNEQAKRICSSSVHLCCHAWNGFSFFVFTRRRRKRKCIL